MKYPVLWRKTSRDQLLAIWKTDTDRGAITEAIAIIEDFLEMKPNEQGEPYSDSLRLLVQGPLACVYWPDEKNHRVVVLSVRLLPGRSSPQ